MKRTTYALVLCAVLLTITSCANLTPLKTQVATLKSELERAQQELAALRAATEAAQAEAEKARAAAAAAESAANQGLAAAQASQACCDAGEERINRMFKSNVTGEGSRDDDRPPNKNPR